MWVVIKATMESKTEGTTWKSIKNYIRNWCQKWCCILFGAIYRENKQWSPRYHFIYYYFLMSLVARGFLLQNHISSSILRIMGSSSLRDCFSVFPLQMAWLDLANIVSYSNESVSFKWELPIMPLSFHQKWGAIERIGARGQLSFEWKTLIWKGRHCNSTKLFLKLKPNSQWGKQTPA